MKLKYLVAYTIFWGLGPSQFKTFYDHAATDEELERLKNRLRLRPNVYWINIFEFKECIEIKKEEV